MSEAVIREADRHQLGVYGKLPIVIDRASDVWIFSNDGRKLLDLYGGHAVCVTGHNHPHVVQALKDQSERLLFYSNLVYNSSRAAAARDIVGMAPESLTKVFFVNSGAEANDNAIKLARMIIKRRTVVSFEGGFHGRTIGTLSATGLGGYREKCEPRVPSHRFATFGDLDSAEESIDDSVAAVLLEPIQSMAGVRAAHPGFYQGLRRICDARGALLIYDEIQTGMGRTGEFFFAPRFGVVPDMITMAKGIASGVPAGALLVNDLIASSVARGDLGSTFGGSPLACAAISATIAVIRSEGLLENVRQQSRYLEERCRALESVEEVLGSGFLIGLKCRGNAADYQRFLFERGIVTGLSAHPRVLRLLPPLTLRKAEIDLFLGVLSEAPARLESTA